MHTFPWECVLLLLLMTRFLMNNWIISVWNYWIKLCLPELLWSGTRCERKSTGAVLSIKMLRLLCNCCLTITDLNLGILLGSTNLADREILGMFWHVNSPWVRTSREVSVIWLSRWRTGRCKRQVQTPLVLSILWPSTACVT